MLRYGFKHSTVQKIRKEVDRVVIQVTAFCPAETALTCSKYETLTVKIQVFGDVTLCLLVNSTCL
jgi:hypothetical protein